MQGILLQIKVVFFKIVLLENENEVKKFFIDESIVCFKLFSLYYFVSD